MFVKCLSIYHDESLHTETTTILAVNIIGLITTVVVCMRTNFALINSKPSTRQRNVSTEENIATVVRVWRIHICIQFVSLCLSNTMKILRMDFGLCTYNI